MATGTPLINARLQKLSIFVVDPAIGVVSPNKFCEVIELIVRFRLINRFKNGDCRLGTCSEQIPQIFPQFWGDSRFVLAPNAGEKGMSQ